MNQQTRFVIYGIQRTGTIFLMSLLDSHPNILCIGELFQNKSECVQYSIPRYKLYIESSAIYQVLDSVIRKIKLNGYLGTIMRKIMINRYLDTIYSLSATTGNDAIGFKLMLNQVKRYPIVLDYLSENKFKVIHVVRENILKTYISRLRAQQTGVYASTHPTQKIKVPVPINSLLEDLDSLSEENNALGNSVSRLGLDHLTISYEQIAHNREPELQEVLSFLGVSETAELKSRLVKLTPDNLEQAVENYDEIVNALKHTKYGSYLC